MHPAERHIILLLRLLMAWTFLYSASHQVLVPNFSVVGFMNSTKRFHGLFVLFTPPTLAPDCQFPRRVGHTLIGLSLLPQVAPAVIVLSGNCHSVGGVRCQAGW